MKEPWVFDFAFRLRLPGDPAPFALDLACQSRAQRLAVSGPSGSGKSLTLQLLAGLMRPDAGHVCVNGRCWGDTARRIWLPPQQRAVGLVYQDYALFPHLTVAQNIAFGRHRCWRNPPRRADAETAFWLERMQLEAVAAHYPHQISGGQKQRAALARACITRPQWLLLDEPFSALDRSLRGQMHRLVAGLQSELGIPMLLVSHHAEDAAALAEECWRLENGRLEKQ